MMSKAVKDIFHFLPEEYQLKKDCINNEYLKKLYSHFDFCWFHSNNNEDNEEKKLLQDFFNNYYFITYDIKSIPKDDDNNILSKTESQYNMVTAVICIEKRCIVIDSMSEQAVNDILSEFPNQKLNSSKDSPISDEIDHFIGQLAPQEIKSNDFLKLTIRSVSAYIIHRQFYPKNYFNDPSFFTFNQGEDKTNSLHNFNESDFIFLKKIGFDNDKTIHLVIHIDSFYIFAVKTVSGPEKLTKKEIDFYNNYSHRCLVKLYGFISSEKYQGFVYEYMSNGTLYNIISATKEHSFFYLFMIMIRIWQSINYLQSNNIIHRDLKPNNILFDQDLIPYLSDLEYARSVSDDDQVMTANIGSNNYMSPEQFSRTDYSLPTDIYSFGLITYFIFEGEDMIDSNTYLTMNSISPIFKKTPLQIRELILKCIKKEPNDRIKYEDINKNIVEQINSLYFFDPELEGPFSIKSHWGKIKPCEIDHFLQEILRFFEDSKSEFSNNIDVYFKKIIQNNTINGFYDWISNFYFDHFQFKKAKYYYEILIELNSSDAYYRLGKLYYNGFGVEKDILEAKKLYEKAVEKNNPVALIILGNLYKNGEGVEKNINKAIKLYQKSADLGYSTGFTSLGLLYLNGIGVDQDDKKAEEYFQKSANLNNTYGLIYLANYYKKYKNYEKAYDLYKKSADLNEPEAFIALGDMHLYGIVVQKDMSTAIKYYNKAIEQKNSNGYIHLARIYLTKKYGKIDYQKAIGYFEKSARMYNSSALVSLGTVYSKGIGVKKNYSLAMNYYTRAVQLNDAYAQMQIGYLYLQGLGVPRNYMIARQNFLQSAKRNNFQAFIGLGILFSKGYGVEKNFEKAERYLKLASKRNEDALYYLGDLYLNYFDELKESNYIEAFKYYNMSKSYKKKLYKLGKMFEYGFGTPHDILQAMRYYELSAEKGSSQALVHIGNLYYNGYIGAKNAAMAIEYYKKAAEKDNIYACIILGKIYMKGVDAKKDYCQTFYYFRKIQQDNPLSNYYIGKMYYYGYGLEKSYIESIKYFKKSSKNNSAKSFYYLALIYENGLGVDKNMKKAIKYYKKCVDISKEMFSYIDENNWDEFILNNNHYYSAYNNLGLIYIFEDEDIELSKKYLEIPGYSEYAIGKNNFGLLCEFYLNQERIAEKMYESSAKHEFSLAEFNLARIKENKGEDDSIRHYINVSKYENKKLKTIKNYKYSFIILPIGNIDPVYHYIYDEILEISKIFIVFLANIKLVYYYLNKNENQEAIKYFVHALFRPLFKLLFYKDNRSYSFILFSNEYQKKSNLIELILKFPLFDISNEINENEEMIENKNHWKTIEQDNQIKEVILNIELSDIQHNIGYKDLMKNIDDEYEQYLYFDVTKEIENIFGCYNEDKRYKMEWITDKSDDFKVIQIKCINGGTIGYLKYSISLNSFLFKVQIQYVK